MLQVKFTVTNLKEFTRKMEPFRDSKWAQAGIREGIGIISRGIKSRYDAGVDPDGGAWAPLKPSTIKRKGGRGKILVMSGALRGSIHVVGVNQMAYKVVAADMPGQFHQGGTSKMVARPFMGISAQDKTQVLNMLRRRLRALG
jgi:phage gpG-like protein